MTAVNTEKAADSTEGLGQLSSQQAPLGVQDVGCNGQDANELAEQDISEEDDDYRETFVQRYVPGVCVNVKLKDVYRDDNEKMQRVPMVIDFFEECLRTYKDEGAFIYEDSYLRSSHNPVQMSGSQNGTNNPSYAQAASLPGKRSDNNSNNGTKSVPINAATASERKGTMECTQQEVTLDDVKWLKNRPNDPLLKCIQSITDRLNIQGIVGDPASYLKVGGDDMHYDIDDPFIDDADMYSELKMSRNDILQKGQIEKDFSVWSEEEEQEDAMTIQAEAFVAEYASACNLEGNYDADTQKPLTLIFNPGGWKRFSERVPKQFRPLFKDFENAFKGYTGYITTDDITEALKTLLSTIFTRLAKMQEPKRRKITRVKEYSAHEADEMAEQRDAMERHGLNCIGVGRIIGINGRIMRWIVRTVSEMTNALSCYQINETWIRLVLEHNADTIKRMETAIITKVKPKLMQMKDKRSGKYFIKMDNDLKDLARRISPLRKVVREYEAALETYTDPVTRANGASPNDVDLETKRKCKSTVKQGAPKPSNGNDEMTGEESQSQGMTRGEREYTETEHFNVAEEGTNNMCLHCSQSSNDMSHMSSNAVHDLPDSGELTLEALKSSMSEDEARNCISNMEENGRNCTQDDPTFEEQPYVDGGIPSFCGILRQSKLWKRIKNVIAMYKLASVDLLALVQMMNLALATSLAIGATDFKPLVKDEINLTYAFDKAYIRLADIFSELVEEASAVKITIPTDVSRVAVMFMHEQSTVEDLFEYENKDPLVFSDNSNIAAAPGRIKVLGNRRSRKLSTLYPEAVDEHQPRQLKKDINQYIHHGQLNMSGDLGNSVNKAMAADGSITSKAETLKVKQNQVIATHRRRKPRIAKDGESGVDFSTENRKNTMGYISQSTKRPRINEASPL
ncbi:hypothetical protein X943_003854 [Babesia divergens]|uniref:Hpc2-related domain-containing protein n=1 Tax=Babesia divergens TaxID=32595 RepID=A0AAD9LIH4_BABDI|nr:hypothetical protein X943_003854 [Babesia divergens]